MQHVKIIANLKELFTFLSRKHYGLTITAIHFLLFEYGHKFQPMIIVNN